MLDVLGCRVHVRETGQGPPVLFLHGNPDSSQMWAPVMAALAPSYRCLAPDLPGFGLSSAPPDFDYSLAGQAAFMNALHSALKLPGPVHVVAHDFGGIFGAAWIASSPDRVRSFAVSNSAFCRAFRWHFWARVWRTPWLGELSMLMMNRVIFGLELRRGSRGLTKEHIDKTYTLLTPAVKRTVLRLYRAVRRPSFAGWEERYRDAARAIPVMVLWGGTDPYIPAEMAGSFGARRVVDVPDAGHWLPVVEPARMSRELASFLAGTAWQLADPRPESDQDQKTGPAAVAGC